MSTTLTADPAAADEPGMMSRLGIVGMTPIEPVLIAALVTAEPLLLIGPHGTGKSYLLNRVAAALGLEARHYNASLLNFDDLVGYPLPGADGALEYVRTPASIWDARAVFFDEISRCRIDLQNKLFPIIHERRVQGILLDRLVYRWSAMNPPCRDGADDGADDDDASDYRGSVPLDPALADRFAFVVEVPRWTEFTERQQERVILAVDDAVDPAVGAALRGTLGSARTLRDLVRAEMDQRLAAYVRMVTALLREAGADCSARRAGMILRNIGAVHAVRLVATPDADPGDSAYLALRHSLPHAACGGKVDSVKLLAAHREAWRITARDADDPLRFVMGERDPVRRVLRASRIRGLAPADFSGIVADAIAELPVGGRHALAATLFETGAAGNLVAAIAEQCAELYAVAASPQEHHDRVLASSTRHTVWQRVVRVLAALPKDDPETELTTNLLVGLFGADAFATETDVDRACGEWRRVRAASGRAEP